MRSCRQRYSGQTCVSPDLKLYVNKYLRLVCKYSTSEYLRLVLTVNRVFSVRLVSLSSDYFAACYIASSLTDPGIATIKKGFV